MSVIIQLFTVVFSAEVVNELGTVSLTPQETYFTDLYHYFDGVFQSYKIIESTATSASIGGDISIKLLDTLIYTNSTGEENLLLLVYSGYYECTILVCHGLLADLYLFNMVTEVMQLVFTQEFTYDINDDAAIKYGIVLYNIEVLGVQSFVEIEGNKVEVNELSVRVQSNDTKFLPISMWDVRYFTNLKISATLLPYIVFAGDLYGESTVFIYNFSSPTYPELLQTITTYNFIQQITTTLHILDIYISASTLYLLDSYLGLVIYTQTGSFFQESVLFDLTIYGKVYKFTYKSAVQESSLDYLGIITEGGIIAISSFFQRENFLVKAKTSYGLGEVRSAQFNMPYCFLNLDEFDSTFLQIHVFQDFWNRPLKSINLASLVPDFNSDGPWAVFMFNTNYYYIRADDRSASLFSFYIYDNYLQAMSFNDSYITVSACDLNGCVESSLYIKIITEMSNVYLINDFRQTFPSDLNQVMYFDDFFYTTTVDVLSIISGWYTTYEFLHDPIEPFTYTAETKSIFSIIGNYSLTEDYIGCCFMYNDLYTFNSSGVFVNSTYIADDPDPRNILCATSSLIIVYRNYLAFYDQFNGLIQNITTGIECLVIKSIYALTLCANNDRVIVINNFAISYILNITDTGLYGIIDITASLGDTQRYTDIVFVLTDHNIMIYYCGDNIILGKVVNLTGTAIASSNNRFYLLSSDIYIYSLDFSMQFQIIPVSGDVSYFSVSQDIISLIVDGELMLLNGMAPVLESLISTIPTDYCELGQSMVNTYSFLCDRKVIVYSTTCPDDCNIISLLNISISNDNNLTRGSYTVNLPVLIIGQNNIFEIYIEIFIYAYDLTLNYDDEYWPENLTVYFDESALLDLDNIINGFNVETTLMINGIMPTAGISPAYLYPRVTECNYFSLKNSNFIDHDFIKNTNIIAVLADDSIYFLLVDVPDEEFVVNEMKILQKIALGDLGTNITCQTLDYVAMKMNKALLIISCIELSIIPIYFAGVISDFIEIFQNSVIFIEFETKTMEVVNILKFNISHEIGWIKVITSSSSCFILAIIDSPSTVTSQKFNNHIYRYLGIWQNDIQLIFKETICFYTLGVKKMFVSSVDGIFKSNSQCDDTQGVTLFVADYSTGIQVLLTKNGISTRIHEVIYNEDSIISIGICGHSLFALTTLTFVDIFLIDEKSLPRFYVSFPPNVSNKFVALNSVVACSDYYYPTIVSVFLYSNENSYYILRLIDLQDNFVNSLFHDIIINGALVANYKPKSTFINGSYITSIENNQNSTLHVKYISESVLLFPAMNKSEYESMVSIWESNNFSLILHYSNQFLTKITSPILLNRIGPPVSSTPAESDDLTWIWIVVAMTLLILILVSVFVYKRLIGRKRNQVTETISVISNLNQLQLNYSILSSIRSVAMDKGK